MLQELGKQNPNLMRLIQNRQADFLDLINEPVEGGEGYEFFFDVAVKLSRTGICSSVVFSFSITFRLFFLLLLVL